MIRYSLLIVCAACAFATAAPAATIFMDAAETDIYGNPLAKPAIRMRVDNRVVQQAAFADTQALATDLTGISFQFDFTGTLLGAYVYMPDDPNSPWYGADVAPMVQTLDGVEYSMSRYWTADNVVHPAWVATDLTTGEQWELREVVPVGLIWEPLFYLEGWDQDPVVLFHSPATGEVASNEGTWSLSDDDPRPQTVPEPATLSVLALGGLAVVRRRKR